jgi:hypothetical protein
VDGHAVGNASAAPYTYAWDSTAVADGTHTVAARAIDGAGNATTSAPVSITVTNANLLKNPSLETASGTTPTCWLLGGYGTNTYSWTRTSDAHAGSYSETLNVTAYTNGDRKMVNTQDAGACAPAGVAGRIYTITAWYKSTVGSYIYVYYRNAAGSWVYWTQSAKLAASTSWTEATFITPALPAGATNFSIGAGIGGVGSITLDDFGLFLGS